MKFPNWKPYSRFTIWLHTVRLHLYYINFITTTLIKIKIFYLRNLTLFEQTELTHISICLVKRFIFTIFRIFLIHKKEMKRKTTTPSHLLKGNTHNLTNEP